MWCDWPRPFVQAVIAKRRGYATANYMGAIVTVIATISRAQAFRAKNYGEPKRKSGAGGWFKRTGKPGWRIIALLIIIKRLSRHQVDDATGSRQTAAVLHHRQRYVYIASGCV